MAGKLLWAEHICSNKLVIVLSYTKLCRLAYYIMVGVFINVDLDSTWCHSILGWVRSYAAMEHIHKHMFFSSKNG